MDGDERRPAAGHGRAGRRRGDPSLGDRRAERRKPAMRRGDEEVAAGDLAAGLRDEAIDVDADAVGVALELGQLAALLVGDPGLAVRRAHRLKDIADERGVARRPGRYAGQPPDLLAAAVELALRVVPIGEELRVVRR